MTPYRAPVLEIRFALEVADSQLGDGRRRFAWNEVDSVVDGCAKFAEQVYAPLNSLGDREGCRFENGRVSAPAGFKEAYQAYARGGWSAVSAPQEFGGQGLPFKIAIAVAEMLNSANLSLAMGSMPTPGAIELLKRFGSEKQKQFYLPRIVSGEWTVTMAMTEPQAGSDLGAISTRAHVSDGGLVLKGKKSLITWGEHNFTNDILHLVLARSPDGPAGVKGLSLYLASKRSTDGEINDIACLGLEKKMGLRGSPTVSLSFGDSTGTKAELLGQENRGLEQMFVLLNQARIRVATFALGSAERSLQAAQNYANSRVQGRDAHGKPTVIANHPDVQRMLTSMEARTQAIRLLIHYVAALVDLAADENRNSDATRTELEILTPIAKAWCTELAFEVTSTGVQIFGGIGYSEECEVSQYFREARVHMIYEGTTGIQANDLIFRKIRRDDGVGFGKLLTHILGKLHDLECGDDLSSVREMLIRALNTLSEITRSIVARNDDQTATLQANGSSVLMFAGAIVACWLSIAAASAAGNTDARRKTRNARHMVEQCLAPAEALARTVLSAPEMNTADLERCA